MENKKIHEKTWYVALMTILLFPIGIVLILANKHYTRKTKIISTSCILLAFASILVSAGSHDNKHIKPLTDDQVYSDINTKWYSGGTLHQASLLDWQNASYKNKLATSADFVAKTWKDQSFKPEIQSQISSIDDLRILADEMVVFIDTASEPQDDHELNAKMYANQKVSEFAAIGFIMMQWVK